MEKLKNHLSTMKDFQNEIQTKHIELQGMSEQFVSDFEKLLGIKPQEQVTAYQVVELFLKLEELSNDKA